MNELYPSSLNNYLQTVLGSEFFSQLILIFLGHQFTYCFSISRIRKYNSCKCSYANASLLVSLFWITVTLNHGIQKGDFFSFWVLRIVLTFLRSCQKMFFDQVPLNLNSGNYVCTWRARRNSYTILFSLKNLCFYILGTKSIDYWPGKATNRGFSKWSLP